MISDSQNTALLKIAELAKPNPLWVDYSKYCILREQGLRKQSLIILDNFISAFKNWEILHQIKFTEFIYELAENIKDADYGPLPHPLIIELKKVLLKWIEKETKDSRPFRWLAKYFYEDYADKALEINPQDDKTRELILYRLSEGIYYSTHHLPHYYIGDPTDDLYRENLARQHINQLTNFEKQQYWIKELELDMELVKNYIDWKNTTSNLNFEEWGKLNNKKYSSGIRAYYYG